MAARIGKADYRRDCVIEFRPVFYKTWGNGVEPLDRQRPMTCICPHVEAVWWEPYRADLLAGF